MPFVTHELLRRGAVEERAYQVNIAKSCLSRSTLVVLPTGMGKTVVAAMVIAETLRHKGGRVLFLAPTKPLVEQHAASLREMLIVDRIAVFTGEVASPEDRELGWRENKIIVSTPQVIKNELKAGRYDLEGVSLIVFDEAHRAVGDYAYVSYDSFGLVAYRMADLIQPLADYQPPGQAAVRASPASTAAAWAAHR